MLDLTLGGRMLSIKCERLSPTSVKDGLSEVFIRWENHETIALRFWVRMWRLTHVVGLSLSPSVVISPGDWASPAQQFKHEQGSAANTSVYMVFLQ